MVDQHKIESLFRELDGYLESLRQLALLAKEELVEDQISLGAAKYYLQVSIECCINVANHVISRNHFRAPSTYADSFAVLAENGVIEPEFQAAARRMVQMRNRLVHLYWEVDADILYDTLQRDLADFDRFKGYIYRYVRATE